MAVYSTHQNRQLYVATSVGTVDETSKAGTIEVKSLTNGIEKELFFNYMGADTPLRSDLIQLKNLVYAKAVSADDMADKLRQVKVTLDPDINEGNPVSGQDYVLNIVLRQYYGMSDEDQYYKYGAVHATKDMSASDFYAKMAESLEKNFSKEVSKCLSFEASDDGLLIKEVEQPWHLGTYAQERVNFDVLPTAIWYEGSELVWGVTQATGEVKNSKGEDVEALEDAGTVKDGHKIADLEWFCMGERGDQYRGMGWPNVVPTKYMVDPDKEYHALELHYAFTDEGTSSYHSEKDITIVAEDSSVINSLVEAINSAAGLEIETL